MDGEGKKRRKRRAVKGSVNSEQSNRAVPGSSADCRSTGACFGPLGGGSPLFLPAQMDPVLVQWNVLYGKRLILDGATHGAIRRMDLLQMSAKIIHLPTTNQCTHTTRLLTSLKTLFTWDLHHTIRARRWVRCQSCCYSYERFAHS